MNVEIVVINRLIIARKYDIPISLGHIRLTYSQLSCADNVILRISLPLPPFFLSLSLSLSLSLYLSSNKKLTTIGVFFLSIPTTKSLL